MKMVVRVVYSNITITGNTSSTKSSSMEFVPRITIVTFTIEVNGDDLKRTITRAACDPFTCYRGLGGSNANHESADKEMEEIAKRLDDDSKPSGVPLHAMDPQGESPWYLGEYSAPPVVVIYNISIQPLHNI